MMLYRHTYYMRIARVWSNYLDLRALERGSTLPDASYNCSRCQYTPCIFVDVEHLGLMCVRSGAKVRFKASLHTVAHVVPNPGVPCISVLVIVETRPHLHRLWTLKNCFEVVDLWIWMSTRMFQKSNDDQVASLKHSKSMPYRLDGIHHEPLIDPFKPVYRGNTPLKASDIVYVEQAPGMLDIHRAQMYQDISDHPPTRAHFETCGDLLDKFPHTHQPPPKATRSGLRTTSLNSNSIRPQPPQNNNTSRQHTAGRERILQRSPSVACFSHPTATAYPSLRKQQRREATVDQALDDILKPAHGKAPLFGSSRQAERIRAKSSAGRSYTPAPPAAPPSYHPLSTSDDLAVGAQLTGQSYRPHANYHEFLQEQDPHVIRAKINRYPVAPLYSERLPEHFRPIRFDMEDPRQFQKTLGYFIQIAVAQGRPLDARADGPYRRIIEAGDPAGIVPEIGSDWSRQM
ncbi:hypothetical protein DFH29DRAFT_1072253 [Suillus ampliporus]|nr:hypothetical protein DFH29DRAFT_1072253 [Suillus ampliporus]